MKAHMLTRFALLATIILLGQVSMAQKEQKILRKADVLYQEQKYDQALKLYQKVSKTDAGNEAALLQSARCNTMLGSYTEADRLFEQLFYASQTVEPNIFLEYGDVLMKVGKPNEARTYFGSYNNLVEKNDLRALNYIEAIENYDKYFIDSSFIDIVQSAHSSVGNDKHLAVYNNKLYITSNAKNLKSNPLSYILYSGNVYNPDVKLEKIDVLGVGKVTFDGVAVAQATDEFFFTTIRDQHSELYRSFIKEDGSSLSKAELISIDGFDGHILEIAASATGSTLIFSSDAPTGSGGTDLYRCQRNSYGYSQPELLGGFINTLGNESHPYLVNDSMLFFASNGHGGVGGMDIYYINLNKPGSLPKNLGYPINSWFDEYGLVIYNEGRNGYLISERNTTQTFADIFGFELKMQRATGEVVDKNTGQNLKNVGVDIKREGEDLYKFALADNGRFSVTGKPGESFELNIWREGYEVERFYVNTSQSSIYGLFEVGIGKFPIVKSDADADTTPVIDEYFTQLTPVTEEPEPKEPVIEESVIIEPVVEPIVEKALEPEPVIEPKIEPEPIKPEPVSTGTVFRLQIAASRTQLSNSSLRAIYSGSREIFMYTEENWYKYAIADFDSYYEANQERKLSGVKGAFIAAYRHDSKLILRSAIQETVTEELRVTDKSTTSNDIAGIISTQEIFFSYNAIRLSTSEQQKLTDIVSSLRTDPGIQVKIIGHTDKLGSELYNYGLAKERAEFVMKYLADQGIDTGRISIVSSGETNLKLTCTANCTPQVHKQNRRAEIILYR